eukprot:s953_g24.t1
MVRMIIRCQVQEEEMCQAHEDLCGPSLGDSPLRAGGATCERSDADTLSNPGMELACTCHPDDSLKSIHLFSVSRFLI